MKSCNMVPVCRKGFYTPERTLGRDPYMTPIDFGASGSKVEVTVTLNIKTLSAQ